MAEAKSLLVVGLRGLNALRYVQESGHKREFVTQEILDTKF
jgi:hypothetical protein